jgi:exfoliative toxin A/B
LKEIIKKVPLQIGGLALALASLGTLIAQWVPILKPLCGILSLILLLALVLKTVLYPKDIQRDIKKSMIAAVIPISFIAIAVLDTYIANIFPLIAKYIWLLALATMLYLLVWFIFKFVINNFKIKDVYTSWYIPFVGLCVMAWISPVFNMSKVGYWLFWIGFITNIIVSILAFYRHFKFETPESAKPMFAIFPSPFASTVAAYLAVVKGEPNLFFVVFLITISQILFVITIKKLPSFLKKPFYPSWVGLTFPFLITSSMLRIGIKLLRNHGYQIPRLIDLIYSAEIIFATVMVVYVFGHYCKFLLQEEVKKPVKFISQIKVK